MRMAINCLAFPVTGRPTRRAAQLLVRGFRNIGKVQLTIRHMPDALCALPGAR